MEVFFWITDLLIPITMIGVGYWFKKNPPKSINWIYGYRTKRSMSSQEAWDVAQCSFGQIWFKVGVGLLVIIILDKLLMPIHSDYLSLINTGLGILAMIICIPVIEKKIK